MTDEVSNTNNMQGIYNLHHCTNMNLLRTVVVFFSLFTAIEEILGVIIPRMKEFHDLLVRPPNVSLLVYDVHIHVHVYMCIHVHVQVCIYI